MCVCVVIGMDVAFSKRLAVRAACPSWSGVCARVCDQCVCDERMSVIGMDVAVSKLLTACHLIARPGVDKAQILLGLKPAKVVLVLSLLEG